MEEVNDEPIGIDLGTTFSCIGVFRSGGVEILPNSLGDRLTPSIVSFVNNEIKVGEEAVEYLIKEPKNTVYGIKRIIGLKYDNPIVQKEKSAWPFIIEKDYEKNRPKIKIVSSSNEITYYFPEEISSFILRKLLLNAEEILGKKITKAVITVPAYFNNSQRNATKIAGELAGLKEMRIINEPTSASLAYALQNKIFKDDDDFNFSGFTNNSNSSYRTNSSKSIGSNNSNIINKNNIQRPTIKTNKSKLAKKLIVFDLGGGTFDVSILSYTKENKKNCFEILSTSGDTNLGGEDFDRKILDYCLKDFCKKMKIEESIVKENKKCIKRLQLACEKAKKFLSNNTETEVKLDNFYESQDLFVKMTRPLFELICKDLFDRLQIPLEEALSKILLNPELIEEVILIGGSTRIPKIKEIVSQKFPKAKINNSINADEAVAIGATIESAKISLAEDEDIKGLNLLDITPLSLGISTVNSNINSNSKGNIMSIVVNKGTKIPSTKVKEFKTSRDKQTTMIIDVFEGENKYVKNDHLIGKFKLSELTPRNAGMTIVEVNFNINVEGILTVTAIEKEKQNNQNSIKIIDDRGELSENEKQKIKDQNISLSSNYDNNNVNNDIVNLKKDMIFFHKSLDTAENNEDKIDILNNLIDVIKEFLNYFNENEFENESIVEKYFYYIKILFEAYKMLLNITEEHKKEIVEDIKNMLAKFKHKSKNYLMKLTDIFKGLNNKIFYDLVIYVMELFVAKGNELLDSKDKKYNHYYAKLSYEDALEFPNEYIKKEKIATLSRDVIKRYQNSISICESKLRELNTNSNILVEKAKNDGKLYEFTGDNIEELYFVLDNYRESLRNLEGCKKNEKINLEAEAIYLANIVKIKYKYLESKNIKNLRTLSEQSLNLAMSINKNVENYGWYKEIKEISTEFRNQMEKDENSLLEEFENKYKNENQNIFDGIDKTYKEKTTVEFIKYILDKYPYDGYKKDNLNSPDKKFRQNKKDYLRELRSKYHPDNYNKNTDEEKKRYTIIHYISIKINDICDDYRVNSSIKG